MPTTASNITKIKAAVQNYTREQIRDELNELQMIIYSENTMQAKKIDSATGMPPYIETIAGQFEYDCPADCRETLAVFVGYPQNGYSAAKAGGGFPGYVYGRNQYYRVAVSSTNALVDQVAKIIFVNDPGTTTDKYYHNYMMKPPDITSENIQMAFPEEVHYLVRKAVIALLSSENYGETGFDDAMIKEISKKIRTKMNKGAQIRSGRTPWQEEFRDCDIY